MCAILDNNVVHEVFGDRQTPAGARFRQWIDSDSGGGQLVVGGRLKDELTENENFKDWLAEATRTPRVKLINDEDVTDRATVLEENRSCASNDEHVIALAQVSGARLLYSRDRALHQDFADRNLIRNPGGSVYTAAAHEHLLRQRNLCRRKVRS